MTQWTWKRNVACCIGAIKKGDETSDLFGQHCCRRISPLFWRTPILLWAIVITFWSVTSFWGRVEMFFLYMTHWGLLLIILESLFGVVVALKNFYNKLPDATFGLPWYVKTYWVLYNITIPVAFLITVFYWGILKSSGKNVRYAPNPVLDVMLHGGNSVVMFVELILSAHPSRLLHVMQPLFFAFAYLLFTVIYYYSGGLDPWGNSFIYPVVDWSQPRNTIIIVTLTAMFLALMHLLVVALAATRDIIARRCLKDTTAGVYNDGFGA